MRAVAIVGIAALAAIVGGNALGESPGVMHTNLFYTKLLENNSAQPVVSYSEAPTNIRFITSEHITDEDPDAPYGVRNHYVSWRPVFDELMVIVNRLPPRPPRSVRP